MTQSSNSFPCETAANRLMVRDVDGRYRAASADEVLSHAKRLLARRVRRGAVMTSPEAVKYYLRLQIGVLEHEVFHVIFLDPQHRFIALKEMFRGTLTQTSLYPREIVKEALLTGCAAVLLSHNHPSMTETPSRADEQLTTSLRTALQLVDVRVLDHFVVTCDKIYSFAEAGRL